MHSGDTLDTRSGPSAELAALMSGYEPDQLILTIAFHPDVARIGQSSCLGPLRSRRRVELGRMQPAFSGIFLAAKVRNT